MIEEIIASEVAAVPDHASLNDLWNCLAYDPQGKLDGIGYGWTPAEAKAAAWITASGWVIGQARHLRAINRTVPMGWTFELYPPGNGPVFEFAQ